MLPVTVKTIRFLFRSLLPLALCYATVSSAGSLDIRIEQGADDAEEGANGTVRLDSTDLELACDGSDRQTVGIRFRNVEIPPRAIVTAANLQFTAKDETRAPCLLCLRAEASADTAPFLPQPRDVSRRAATAASVNWSPAPWEPGISEAPQRSPDIAPLLQEVVNLPGWMSGRPITILATGEGVRRAHSVDGKADAGVLLHVEWREEPAPPVPAAHAHLSARVNAAVDNVMALALRLMELPLFVVLSAAAAVLAVLLLTVARLLRGRASRRHVPLLCVAAAAALGFLAADWRLTMLERRIRDLQGRMAEQQGTLQTALDARGSRTRHRLFDPEAAEKGLRAAFGDVRVVSSTHGEAADLVLIRLAAGPVHAFLAIVDLTHPNLEVRLDSAIGRKTLTSEFARTNRCMLAINGEAGNSPALDSGFGDWIGNFISAGAPILLKDTERRPFLAFDRRNRASYSPARVVATSALPDWHNVIWGRHDALTDGTATKAARGDRQPRTAMAIDGPGTRLYLLVADGRQPGYSVGLTRRDVGLLLAAFGARNGMLCDEGGSSCMYTTQAGIVNSPCDSGGKERPTYTHFGVALGPASPGGYPTASAATSPWRADP
jgi:hypothetical protein